MPDRRNQSEIALQEYANDPDQSLSTSTKRILVVDDEPLIQRLIDRVLSSMEGYSVDLAGDGQTAWLMIQEKHYDCIMLDWRMPGMTGKQLYQLIEGTFSEIANRCLFISRSRHVTNAEVEAFASANGNSILLKPFSIDELRASVSKLAGINRPSASHAH